VIINVAGFLRSLGVGLMGVVLGIYLSRIGFSAFRIGAVIAIGLAGSAAATAVVGFAADRVGRRRFLQILSILTALGGLALENQKSTGTDDSKRAIITLILFRL
jgi:MFS family permease